MRDCASSSSASARSCSPSTEGSQRYYERALAVMPRGVPSSFQAAEPRPIYLSHGEGSHVWDVDGNEYVDFHNGFGVMCVGHAHPAIVAAVRERAGRGSHFAAPTEGSIVVAEELVRRFGMPQWRFTNSGTESTMDAIHLARAATGRDAGAQDRGLLPRPPRRRDGQRAPADGPARRPRRARQRALRRRPPERRERADEGDPVQRRRPARARPRGHRRPGRRAHPRAGDDEHHDRRAAPGLSRARARAHRRATALSSCSTRSRRARPSRPAARSSASASSPTSSAWPRRSPAATPAGPSA